MSSDSIPYRVPLRSRARRSARVLPTIAQRLRARPELVGVLGIATVLNLWGLSVNGWANTYYAAAVRSMSTSWHDFLFASLDKSGLMTVDKPPLSLWVQALSARVFGLHPLSILVPQAVMGVVAVGLLYDLTRRRFGRVAGCAAGIALATTPITVAISRHNNPDQLLILCSVAAVWFALRALETGRTRWLVLCGVCVGLGFETKMGVALLIVPGIAAAYVWVGPRGRLRALWQLLAGGVAMVVVGGAWPLLVTLTPATDRPWISGTSDNSIWSLIFGYNGLGRLAGQTGGPQSLGGGGAGGAGTTFGGPTGVFRLLQSGLGDQAGWLLGFAIVAGAAILAVSRLRRRDPRTGWLIVIGGAFLTTAIAFSFASGIFHPYYVSFLAPFTAALIGAGVGLIVSSAHGARVLAPLAIGAGVITELVVLGGLNGALGWAEPLVIALAGGGALVLALRLARRVRITVLVLALAALLAAPATWAVETLGHPTSSTFPAGGPASASIGGFGGAPGLGSGRFGGRGSFGGSGASGRSAGSGPGGGGAPPGGLGGAVGSRAPAGGVGRGFAPGRSGGGVAGGGTGGFGPAGGGTFAGGGGPFGGDSSALTAAVRYAKAHGGGTIGVESQSSAATVILSSDANVAGLGGFSGRESSVTAAWVAMEVRQGRLRWVLVDGSQGFQGPADTRTGSQAALDVVAKTCAAVTLTTSSATKVTMYDCRGRAPAILATAKSDGNAQVS
jgi:4-amino-4-deoxy-L-arabinose transferase-like glycosyltransferase